MAQLLGLISVLSGLWFLFGMPVMAAVFGWEYLQSRKLQTGLSLLVTVVVLGVFYISAGLIWKLGTADWNLSFLKTLEASVNSEKYGEPLEHMAERMVTWLLLYSTVTAAAAGVVTAVVGQSWIRRRRLGQQRDEDPGQSTAT